MDGFATLLEYISPTTAADQNVAKVLGGWIDTKQAGHPPSLACFEMESHQTYTRVSQFADSLRLLHFAKISPKGFADCLTATLLMYYRDTLAISPQHIVHQKMQSVHAALPQLHSCQEELLDWGSKIRKRFVTDNILSLPVESIKSSLTMEEQAEQFVGVHTFGDTLERLLLGHQELVAAYESLKNMMHQILDRLDHMPRMEHTVCAVCSTGNVAEQTQPPNAASTLELRPPMVEQTWPHSLSSLRGKRLSDFLVQYFVEGLGSLSKSRGNRSQKDCLRAVEIVAYVADLSSIPPIPAPVHELERMQWMSAMVTMASQCETLLVTGLSKTDKVERGKRKRRRSGKLTGIVKAWSELSDGQRAAFRSLSRIRFSAS